MRTIKPTAMWFIGFKREYNRHEHLYFGGSGHSTRKAAIRAHVRDIGRPWGELKKRGDFTVKCIVQPAARQEGVR